MNSILEMSDEEFLKSIDSAPEENKDIDLNNQEDVNEELTNDSQESQNSEEIEEQLTEQETNSVQPTEEDDSDNDSNEEEESFEEDPIDYKAEYEELFKPFKANGKEIKVNNKEEVIKLMQMGANFTQKMQAIKPNIKIIKMLEDNGLLSEEKINFFIDINKKNPNAISKLLQDSELDPLDLDVENDSKDYRPNNYAPNDEYIVLSDIYQENKDDPQVNGIFQHIRSWDTESINSLAKDPKSLNILLEQKREGFYDIVVAEIERQKMFGNYLNVPFLTAYVDAGQRLRVQAGNTGINQYQQPSNNNSRVIDTRIARKNTSQNSSNSEKAKAAGFNKSIVNNKNSNFSILEMSDDEFLNSDFAKNI